MGNRKMILEGYGTMFRLTLFTAIFTLFLPSYPTFAAEEIMPAFTTSKIITSRAGVHTTTRGTIRLVFVHEGK